MPIPRSEKPLKRLAGMMARDCRRKPPLEKPLTKVQDMARNRMAAQQIQQLLEQAFAHHRAGRLAQAEAIYRQILADEAASRAGQSELAEVFYWLGVAQQKQGMVQQAEECF